MNMVAMEYTTPISIWEKPTWLKAPATIILGPLLRPLFP